MNLPSPKLKMTPSGKLLVLTSDKESGEAVYKLFGEDCGGCDLRKLPLPTGGDESSLNKIAGLVGGDGEEVYALMDSGELAKMGDSGSDGKRQVDNVAAEKVRGQKPALLSNVPRLKQSTLGGGQESSKWTPWTDADPTERLSKPLSRHLGLILTESL